MARKRTFVAASLVVVGLGALFVVFARREPAGAPAEGRPSASSSTGSESAAGPARPADFSYRTVNLPLARQTFRLDVADSDAKKTLGLGQRDALAADRGMVFVYDRPGERCFWMKDMRFAIDIIWLDAGRRVVKIEPSLGPDTYPQNYCPVEPAQYVVELPAGAAATAGLQPGDILPLEL